MPVEAPVEQLHISDFPTLKRASFLAVLIFLAPLLAVSGQESAAGSAQVRDGSDRAQPTVSAAPVTLGGVVLDPSNAAIAGAKVTLYGKNLKTGLSTTTDQAGLFQFEGVIPDRYEIEVQQDGFKVSRSRLRVGPRGLAQLRIVLPIADLYQEMTVTNPQDEVRSGAGENADVIRLDRETLDSLPIMDNDIVTAVRNLQGPGSGDTTLIVDGVPAQELGVPNSAVQEVKINQDTYSAEFASPGQKRIQITTKTGSPQYHGSLQTEFRDYLLDARNAFAEGRPPERHLHMDGSFSGPLGKSKKTIFLFSGERDEDNLEAIVHAVTPGGAMNQNFQTPFRSTFFSSVVDRQIGQSDVLSVRYSYYESSYKGKGVGGLTLPDAAADVSSGNHYLFVTYRRVFTSQLINELSARAVSSDSFTGSASEQPSLIVLGAFTGGGAQQGRRQTQNYIQLGDTLSWSHGTHFLKAGINVPTLARLGLDDRSNFGGTFQFSSLQDYAQGKPFSFVQQQGNSRLVFWQQEIGLFAQDEVRLRPALSISFGLRYDWQNYVSDATNFAPRFAFAYAPGKNGKTVLRGGAGVFYQTTGSSAIADMLRFNGQALQQFVVQDPGYPNPFVLGGATRAVPSSIVQFAPDLRLPYVTQYSFGVERQVAASTTLTTSYVGMRGYDQFRSRDVNAPLPPLYTQRPDPSLGMLREIESAGLLVANAWKVSVNTKIGRLFNGMAQYTLGKSLDDTGGISWFPADQYDLTGEWGRSNFDVRHTFNLYGTFTVGKLFNLGAILTLRSGMPYTETTGTDIYGTTFGNARPPGVPRNSLEGPGAATLDLRWAKQFSFNRFWNGKETKERMTGKIGLDAFNIFNQVNFGQPVGVISSPFFGLPVSAGPARRLQISLGFRF
jgi:Carboxypeptidase regulatory-like domain/TonB dependent receptor